MNNANWILINGKSKSDHSTFPFAFREAYFLIEAEKKAKRPPLALIKGLKILGPPNSRNERTTYSWSSASDLARSNGLLTVDGSLNSKEFKRR
jgi:hypothetical protein